MSQRFRDSVEAQIRAAAERGEFENLPGAGKPLPDAGQPLEEDWWLRDKVRRGEFGSEVLPTTLRLRRELEDLPAAAAKRRTEREVRELVADLNKRITVARIGPVDGPPVALRLADADEIVRGWRERRCG